MFKQKYQKPSERKKEEESIEDKKKDNLRS